jgi:hypothetical protein
LRYQRRLSSSLSVFSLGQVNRLGPNFDLPFVEHGYQLPNTTTIHTHGLHMDPGGIADNIFRMVKSGEEALSVYHIPDDHQCECGSHSFRCVGFSEA